MPLPEGERIATIEAELRGVREDVQALTVETERARRRLHDLEGSTRGLLELNKQQRQGTADRQRRLEVRMSLLTAAIAVAAFLEPFLYGLARH